MVRLFVTAMVLLTCLPGHAQFAELGFPIINGEPATDKQLYGTVAIVSSVDNTQFCTGTLIAPTVVVTAAHCFYDFENHKQIETADSVEIIAGVLDTTTSPDANRYAVTKLVYHADFPGGGTVDDAFLEIGMGRVEDIALVVVERPIGDVSVMPILPPALHDQVFTTDAPLIITGYGTTDLQGQGSSGTLHIAETVYRDRTDSELWGGKKSSANPCTSDEQCGTGLVCVQNACVATDTCSGDSGGPVYVEHNATIYLVGIVSRGVGDTFKYCGEGGIYTLASSYLQWLANNSDGAFSSVMAPDSDVTTPDSGDSSDGAEPKKSGSSCAIGPTPSPQTSPLLVFLLAIWALRRRCTSASGGI